MKTLELAPPKKMLNLIGDFWIARSIYLAAELGVADALNCCCDRVALN